MLDGDTQNLLREKYNPDGSLLRSAQLRMLDILAAVDHICRTEGIDYWMDAGTLLGAARHGGFIPWDDDLDICILKKDYKKFKAAMLRNLPSNLAYQDWTTDPCHFEMAVRIRDVNSLFDQQESRFQKWRGLFLDVVLLEKMPSMGFHNFLYPLYGRVTRTIHNHGYAEGKTRCRIVVEKIGAYALYPLAGLLRGAGKVAANLLHSDLVGRYYSGFRNPRHLKTVFPLAEMEFEGRLFKAPADTDAYLKDLFGDYSKLPSENLRGGHEVKMELY